MVAFVVWTLAVLALEPHYPETGSNLFHGLRIADPVAFESAVNDWPGVVTVGVFAHQKASVCLVGTPEGVRTLTF